MAKKTPKTEAWTACSKYIRLRDSLAYCKRVGMDVGQFIRPEDIIGDCCTCGATKSWFRMDAGHFKGRGIGGGSGVYFDERNIHLQCKPCNGLKQGAYAEYEKFIIKQYGQKVLDELSRKHHVPIDMRPLAMKAMKMFYEEKYQELVKGLPK